MEWFVELVQYATQGFWVFLGCYFIILTCSYVIANVIIKIIENIFKFFTVLLRGYPHNNEKKI